MNKNKLRNLKQIILKTISILGLFVFLISIIAMIIYPNLDKINRKKESFKNLINGEIIYYGQFRFLSKLITIDLFNIAQNDSNNALPLEYQQIDQSKINHLFEETHSKLSIPTNNIEGSIVTGNSANEMNRGFWHYPNSGTLSDNKNIVIFGHRYLYVPPAKNTFYNLNLVEVGTKIEIKSDLGTWSYIVIDKKIIDKTDTSILNLKPQKLLILVTCHPLWTSKQRLVIIAKLQKDGSNI